MAGNDPRLAAALAAATSGDPRALTRADLMLSQAFADRARARQRPPGANAMRYIDPGLAPAPRTYARNPRRSGRNAIARRPSRRGRADQPRARRAGARALPFTGSAGRAFRKTPCPATPPPSSSAAASATTIFARSSASTASRSPAAPIPPRRRAQPRRRLLRTPDPRQYRARPGHPGPARRPLHYRRHRLGAALHGREQPHRRADARDRRQARHADPAHGRHDPLCDAQPLLEPAARPDSRARPQGPSRHPGRAPRSRSPTGRLRPAASTRAASTGAPSPPAAGW